MIRQEIKEIRFIPLQIVVGEIIIFKSYHFPKDNDAFLRYEKKRLHYFCKNRMIDESYFSIY